MSSIGGVSCLFVRRVIPASKLRVRTWIVPGISGTGSKVLGYGDSDWQIECQYWSNNVGANLWLLSLQALQGCVVTIVDDHGDTWLNNLVTKISQPTKRACCYCDVMGVMATLTLSGVRK